MAQKSSGECSIWGAAPDGLMSAPGLEKWPFHSCVMHRAIYVSDFSSPMLNKARYKADDDRLLFVNADLKSLPFPDNFFDLVTISFATRNISTTRDHLNDCFTEIHRVLRPGGRFVNLETSQPGLKFIKWGFHLYVRIIVKIIGSIISGSKIAYKYLSYTIPRFYTAEELSVIINNAGFTNVTFYRMSLGIAAVHIAVK
ncbi:2-methoxy-6-polyprenyl-1,4-benzoquinol methylase [subsurface metagenome]